MPPFRRGPIEVNPGFQGDALGKIRDVGHGHRINVVDASYDIPDGSTIFDFPGSSADALKSIVRLIPIEGEHEGQPAITIMSPDTKSRHEIDKIIDQGAAENEVSCRALIAFMEALEELNQEGVGPALHGRRSIDWMNADLRYRLDADEVNWTTGFYGMANNPDEPHFFVRTIDDLPFACASLIVGHSQLTE